MWFHRHKYNTDASLEGIMQIANLLEKSISELAKQVKELREEVDYLVDFLDD